MTLGLRRRTLENIGYNATSKVVALAFQAVANVVLSRNLSSADYGVVGFAWIFINFLILFNDFGLNSAAVHSQDLDDTGLATAFTLKLIVGLSLFAVAFALAPAVRWVFDDGAVVSIIRLLSLSFVMNAFTFVPSTLLTRALDYRKLAAAATCSTMVNAVLSIVLALRGFGYWSIVVANLAATVISVAVINAMRPKAVSLRLDRGRARSFIRYGWGLFASGLVMFAMFNADSFIIGAVRGSAELGYYMIALSWGAMIGTLMSSVVHSVLFPTFSRIQGERDRVRSAYLLSLQYITVAGILVNATLYVVAPDFLYHVLGHGTAKWLPALTALRVLCVYGVIRVVLEPLGNVLMALGRTRIMLQATLIAAVLELALLYPALRSFGIEGAAVVVTVAYAIQYAIYRPFLTTELGVRASDILGAIGPALAALIVVVPVFVYYEYYTFDTTILLLAQKVAACLGAYVLAYCLITRRRLLADVRALLDMPPTR